MHPLPSPEVLSRVPRLYSTEDVPAEEKVIHLHFFCGHAHWYIAEFDGEDTFFGYADLGNPNMAEWGYISLSELRSIRVRADFLDSATGALVVSLPLAIEWDRQWQPKPFGEIVGTPTP